MKIRIAVLFSIAVLLASCTPGIPTQEVEPTSSVPTAVPFTETAVPQEPVVTVEPTATKSPTQVPSTTPPSCATLITPSNGAALPAAGKVTFSWNPLPEAMFYALNIVLPSGQTVSFETKETARDQYLEVFSAGGQYQWQVVAQDRKRKEICSSELATFSKPASFVPRQPKEEDGKKKK